MFSFLYRFVPSLPCPPPPLPPLHARRQAWVNIAARQTIFSRSVGGQLCEWLLTRTHPPPPLPTHRQRHPSVPNSTPSLSSLSSGLSLGGSSQVSPPHVVHTIDASTIREPLETLGHGECPLQRAGVVLGSGLLTGACGRRIWPLPTSWGGQGVMFTLTVDLGVMGWGLPGWCMVGGVQGVNRVACGVWCVFLSVVGYSCD